MFKNINSNAFRFLSRILLMTFVLSGAGFLTACEDQGPVEEAGEAIDESVEETGDAIEEATD
ncbi:hypothetical protein [Methylophaga nitratireducenticrescens]|uniref:Uncharacterized protein n=1 Tax=Methylophaga nitratireducenticrescens TaxID=754476 RepID=I1XFS1_METNJ|nr:hypothetical protein [Methylophaga nitratireducenticrescens]AFI83240.1 hypothetical protein Q7A_389 [Methylophaga nitratireducenticrescens]AUZ83370.1 hypothetical protein CDW43_01720 [Methylophaga nitratireducenticrescens]